MAKNRYILTDLSIDDPLCRYFNFKNIEFDFLPSEYDVPVVDIIADRIKGKADVVLILGLNQIVKGKRRPFALKQLYEQVSTYNDFKKLRPGMTLIIYDEYDVILQLIAERDNNFGFSRWLNELKPLVLTDGKVGDLLRNYYKDCEFINKGIPVLQTGLIYPEFITMKKHNPKKDYLCLMVNKPGRDFRRKLHEQIVSRDLGQAMIIKFNKVNERNETFADLNSQFQKRIISNLNWYDNVPMIEYYNQTNLELGTEALCSDHDTSFDLSEKTTKPIMMKHPFMMLANKDFLKNLRNLGFQTFHEHLDESYDNESLVDRRIEIIIKNLIDLKGRTHNLYEETKEIRDHNHLHLQHQAGEWETKFWQTMDKVWRNI
jgi:hypothetical protein